MPDPPSENFKPRSDGLIERRGTWGEVTVGCLILGPSGRRNDVWEIVDMANGPGQIPYGYTIWLRVRSREGGEVYAIPPKPKATPATFLTIEPDSDLPARRPASDQAAVQLVLDQLGATEIVTIDNATGEAWAPNYAAGEHATEDWHYGKEEIAHLEICHQVSTGDLACLPVTERIVALHKAHDRAHSPSEPHFGKSGITHRHMPEYIDDKEQAR